MVIWHPDAERQVFEAAGKPFRGGSGNRKLVLHTIESNRWPSYSAPPHLTLNPNTGELRQHVPFDKAAYALRDNTSEDDKFVWQVELWGRAANAPGYSDEWYRNLASLVAWFITEMEVPRVWADFSVMQYGTEAPQRMTPAETDAFAGMLGHAHWGRGTDTHWDPGKLDIERLDRMVGEELEDDDMATPIPIGTEDPRAENVKWAMFYALGGEWNPVLNAADNLRTIPQLDPNPRIVTDSDALVLAGILGTDAAYTSLWPYGAEINALNQTAYAGQPGPPGDVSVFVNGEQVA